MKLLFHIPVVAAGFPSPAEDYIEGALDLNELLVKHPAATFFVRVEGDSMEPLMSTGDLLVIDRSLEVKSKDIVVAVIDGEFTVKRFLKEKKRLSLVPENPSYPTLTLNPESDFTVWGVVTSVIRRMNVRK